MSGRQANLGRAIKILGAQRQAQQVRPMPTKVTDKTYYIAVKANNLSGVIPLVDSNTKKIVGQTNFDGNMLATGRELVIDGMRVLYTTKSASGDVIDADWGDASVLPASFQNCEFRLNQGDPLIDLPMTDLQKLTQDDFRPISSTPLLRSKEEFKMDLEFPKGVSSGTPATGNHFLRLEFRVTEAKK